MNVQAKKRSVFFATQKNREKKKLSQPHGYGEGKRSRWCYWICSCLRCCVFPFFCCKFNVSTILENIIWFVVFVHITKQGFYVCRIIGQPSFRSWKMNEARIPQGRGLWPAIWMLPSKGAGVGPGYSHKTLMWIWTLPLGAVSRKKQVLCFLGTLFFFWKGHLGQNLGSNEGSPFFVASAGWSDGRTSPLVFGRWSDRNTRDH